MSDYQPGVCNIGPEEIRYRRRSGYVGLFFSIVLLGALLFLRTNPLWRLLVFFPIAGGATGFLQAHYHFCAAFGMRGVYNLVKSRGQTDTVIQAEFRKKDKQKSLRIIGQAILIGAFIALVAYLL